MPDNEEKGQEEVKTEEQEKEKQEEWDKEKQRADQAEANVKKLTEEKVELTERFDEVSGTLTSVQEQSDSLTAKLEGLESELADAKTIKADQDKLDPDLVDPSVVKKIETLEAQRTADQEVQTELKAQIEELQETKTRFEAAEEASKEQVAKDSRREKILSKMDERYGAKYRNDAVKLAQEKVEKNGKAPIDTEDIIFLVEDCYKEVLEKALKGKKDEPIIPVDSGAGSLSFKEGEIPEGTLNEVWPKLKAKIKAKGGFSLPTPESE